MPTVALPPATPSTAQMTDVFELFWTLAVNGTVPLARTVAIVGELVIVMANGLGATTSTYEMLVTSPSGVFTTTGTEGLAAGA